MKKEIVPSSPEVAALTTFATFDWACPRCGWGQRYLLYWWLRAFHPC